MNSFSQSKGQGSKKMRLLLIAECVAGVVLLLVGASAVAQPSITVGSATMNPGNSAVLPINFVNNGLVVGMNFDISFDSEIFPAVNFAANCDDLDMGPGTVVCANPSPGTIRIIIHTLPLTPIATSQIGTIELTSDNAAPAGSYGFIINNVVLSDANANLVTPVVLNNGLMGVNTTESVLDVQPTLRDFGSQQVGTISAPWSVIISNQGGGDILEVLDVSFSDGTHFVRGAGDSCPEPPFQLASGALCSRRIEFAPQSEGQHNDMLTVVSNAASVVNDQVALVGTGLTVPADATLVASPTNLDFGIVSAGVLPVCDAISFLNVGVNSVLIESTDLVGNGFTIGVDECSDSELMPTEACQVTVCFAPDLLDTYTGLLRVISNANNAEVALTGELGAVAEPPLLNIHPEVLDLGIGYPATPARTALVAISNEAQSGAQDLILASMAVDGDEAFSLAGGTCLGETVLAAGGPGCSVLVQFAPATTGSFEAFLEIFFDNGMSAAIELLGQGEELDLSSLSDTVVFMGEQGGDGLGGDLWVLTDISGDGLAELVIGAPGAGPGRAGAAYLLFDSMLGLGAFGATPALLSDIAMSDGESGVRIDGEADFGNGCLAGDDQAVAFGYSVAGIDDIGGPGIDGAAQPAFAVSAPGWTGVDEPDTFATRGVVYLLSGAREIDDGSMSVQEWMDEDAGSPFGLRVVRRAPAAPCIGAGLKGLGDIDDDGYADLVISEIPESVPDGTISKSYFIVYGRDGIFALNEIDLASSGETGVTEIVVPYAQGTLQASAAGASAAGDFNGSGYVDFVITAPNALFASEWNDTLHAGAAFLFVGNGDRLPPVVEIPHVIGPDTFLSDVVVIFGPEVDSSAASTGWMGDEHPRFGAAVDFVGNINGDSFDDLVIGSGGNEQWPGSAYVIFGAPSPGPIHIDQLDGFNGFQVYSDAEGAALGNVVMGPGDISGNGLDEIVLGAPGYRLSTGEENLYDNAGMLFIISGVVDEFNSVDFGLDVYSRLDLDQVGSGVVRSMSLAGMLPTRLLEDVRFGFRLVGFGMDVTGNEANDFAVSAPGGFAASGPAQGGWVFVVPGQATATPTDLSLRAFALDAAGLPGQYIAIEVTNVGEAQAEELVLSSQLQSAQSLIGAGSLATGCRLAGDRLVEMVCDVQGRWQCETNETNADCRLAGLEQGAASSIILRLDGDGPVTLSISGAASNSDAVNLEVTL